MDYGHVQKYFFHGVAANEKKINRLTDVVQ